MIFFIKLKLIYTSVWENPKKPINTENKESNFVSSLFLLDKIYDFYDIAKITFISLVGDNRCFSIVFLIII